MDYSRNQSLPMIYLSKKNDGDKATSSLVKNDLNMRFDPFFLAGKEVVLSPITFFSTKGIHTSWTITSLYWSSEMKQQLWMIQLWTLTAAKDRTASLLHGRIFVSLTNSSIVLFSKDKLNSTLMIHYVYCMH